MKVHTSLLILKYRVDFNNLYEIVAIDNQFPPVCKDMSYQNIVHFNALTTAQHPKQTLDRRKCSTFVPDVMWRRKISEEFGPGVTEVGNIAPLRITS